MNKNIIKSVLRYIGVALIVMGVYLTTIEHCVVEEGKTIYQQQYQETDNTNAKLTGGAVGVATGVGAGTAIGGVGVACCGTGIGIPVGVVCIGLASILGFVGYNAVDAITEGGEYVDVATKLPDTYLSISTFPMWACLIIITLGAVMFILSFIKDVKENERVLQIDCK